MHPFHPIPFLAANGLSFAIKMATPEGKTTMTALLILSLFSWTIIITKARQIAIARKWTKKFQAAYAATRDPLDIKRRGEEFTGAPAYQLYIRGADELDYHLQHNPVAVNHVKTLNRDPALGLGNTDHLARAIKTRVSLLGTSLKQFTERASQKWTWMVENGTLPEYEKAIAYQGITNGRATRIASRPHNVNVSSQSKGGFGGDFGVGQARKPLWAS
jgi:hypothetical protein